MKETKHGPAFPLTRWSLVTRAADAEDPSQRAALEELCQLYWFPLYAFARQRGNPPEDAEDCTQGFFLEILQSNLFGEADPSRGKLRTFLLSAFQRYLIDSHRRQKAAKRGGQFEQVPLDTHSAEERYQAEQLPQVSPEDIFDREWALTVLQKSLAELADQYQADGKAQLLEHVKPFLDTEASSPSQYDELCAAAALSRSAARQAVHRVRDRFRQILRTLVADTLRDTSEAAVDEELSALHKILAR